jgi:hypothetical protein
MRAGVVRVSLVLGAQMRTRTYSRWDFPAGVATAARLDNHIETDVSHYHGLMPFRDGGPLDGDVTRGSAPDMRRFPTEAAADGKT